MLGGSPEVHVTLEGEGEDVGQRPPRAAATDEHRHGFDGVHLQELGQAEGRQGHDAELGHQRDGYPLWLQEVGLDFGELHGAAQRDHGDEEDGDGEDVNGFVQGGGDFQDKRASIAGEVSSTGDGECTQDFGGVHPGSLAQKLQQKNESVFFFPNKSHNKRGSKHVLLWLRRNKIRK